MYITFYLPIIYIQGQRSLISRTLTQMPRIYRLLIELRIPPVSTVSQEIKLVRFLLAKKTALRNRTVTCSRPITLVSL